MYICRVETTHRSTLTVAGWTVFFAVAICCSQAAATTYYVRTSGNDSHDGLAPATAFRSIERASKAVTSGDTVYVGGGTYNDSVVLDGIQQSSVPLTFVADTNGTLTGDAGPVIVSNQTVAVVNCNYLEFHEFHFQGAAARLLVWKSSFGGIFRDCVFDGGGEPLLIKDGSVTFEDCQLTDFASDAIYVDGEALVQLVNSSITGCQGEGIEIAKAARVVLDRTTIEDNVGDGIKVAQTNSYIDDGGVGAFPGVTERLAAAKYRIVASAGMFDGYDSSSGPYGPGNSGQDIDLYGNSQVSVSSTVPVQGNVYYGPTGAASAPNVTGTTSQLNSNITMQAIDVGDAATNNNNANIPLSDLGINPLVAGNFALSNGDGLDLPPGTYYFTQLSLSGGSVLRITGPTTIYVTYRVTLSGGSIANPTQIPSDLKLLVTGSLVTLSGSAALQAAIYAPDARVSMSGSTSVHGMVVANEILINSSGGIHLDKSLTSYAAEVQGLPLSGSNPAPPADWNPLTQGEVVIGNSTIQHNRRGVDLETVLSFVARDSYFLDNAEWGLRLNGPVDLDTCSITDNGCGGIWLKGANDGDFSCSGLMIGNNTQYGIYLEDCQVTFNGLMLDQHTFTSGAQYIVASQGGVLTLDGVTITGGTVAGAYASAGALVVRNSTISASGYGIGADQATVEVENCTLTGNATGLNVDQNTNVTVVGSNFTGGQYGLWASNNAQLHVDSSTFSGNSSYGVYLAGNGSLRDCSITGNSSGLYLNAANLADAHLAGTEISGNNLYGVYVYDSSLVLSSQATDGWSIDSNGYNLASYQADISLANATLTNATSYGVYAQYGSLSLLQSTIRSNGGGVWCYYADSFTIDRSHISGSSTGAWGVVNYDAGLTMRNTLVSGAQHGVFSYGTFKAATIYNSTIAGAAYYGLYVQQGDLTVMNTIISGTNGAYGLFLEPSANATHTYNLVHGFVTPFENTTAHSTELLQPPRFQDAANGDFRLAKGSPAINSGVDLSTSHTVDIAGNARPSHKVFELGAYEYVQDGGSLRVLIWKETR